MTIDEPRSRAREAWDRRQWSAVVSILEAAGPAATADDVELLARATWLVGREDDAHERLAHAHRAHLDDGHPSAAVRCAFWLGLLLVQAGDLAQGSGWIARAERLAEGLADDAVERGYLHLPRALLALGNGDAGAARAGFAAALAIGEEAGDPDLTTLGLLGSGQAGVLVDDVAGANARFDEAMVAVLAEEVSPIVAGMVYCGVIAACRDTLELRRAREWTQALGAWCDSQPDLVPYRGQCLVHRAEVLQLSGDWQQALDEVVAARLAFARSHDDRAVGSAWYEEGELHRLRGEVERAEQAYQRAGRAGHAPQPGLALLRVAAGRADVAVGTLRNVVDAASGDLDRARVLPALVEAQLATGAVADARAAADDLVRRARRLDVEWVRAAAAGALGAVLLAEGRAVASLEPLRAACDVWRGLGIPHELARTRLLLARAWRDAGDPDSARIEADAVRRTAEQLGALPLLAAVDEWWDDRERPRPGGLTDREVDVLTQVATGMTNREVAAVLCISDRTVARHLSNIYTKLDLSSRAGATAWAYEHELARADR